ncbi:PTS transporter subunit EIIB, partial [Streptococcus agalactiae]|uniref:PTS transporter subunit EIIB n=1 Tax=Streptococcus agalactiae TaxID=1311 RepID=UPI00292F91D9
MTKYQETAKAILAAVGGEKNIQHVTHCVTRLRLVLDNDEIVNDQVIKNHSPCCLFLIISYIFKKNGEWTCP